MALSPAAMAAVAVAAAACTGWTVGCTAFAAPAPAARQRNAALPAQTRSATSVSGATQAHSPVIELQNRDASDTTTCAVLDVRQPRSTVWEPAGDQDVLPLLMGMGLG